MTSDGESDFVLFALAKEYQKLGDHDLTQKFYQKLVEQYPEYLATYYHFGEFLILTGVNDQAEKIINSGIILAKAQGDLHTKAELEFLLDNVTGD